MLGSAIGVSHAVVVGAALVLALRPFVLASGLLIGAIFKDVAAYLDDEQRRLAEARTTFEDVLDRTRRELAEQYLRDTDMPLYQLARLLGYASPGSLSRASLRWFGRSPRAVRNGR